MDLLDTDIATKILQSAASTSGQVIMVLLKAQFHLTASRHNNFAILMCLLPRLASLHALLLGPDSMLWQ